jgi:ADP-ribose pyrophosphatase
MSEWRLQRQQLADYGIFRVLQMRGSSPRTGEPVIFHGLEMPEWVQVIPVTTDGHLVMVEQFRPGAEVMSLEFPAGLVDPEESAQLTAARELEEETGYQSDSFHQLGVLYANPAIQDNRLHVWLAEACRPTGSVQQDAGEDVRARLVAPAEIPRLIAAGEINHALVLTAWQLYELWRVQRSESRT